MSEGRNLGSIICPNCGKLISSTTTECMHCGSKNPNLWGFSQILRKFFGGQTSLVPIIATMCIALYLLSLALDPSAIFQSRGFLGLLSPSTKSLVSLGMTGQGPISIGHWWTLITAIYLHGGVLHIVFNTLWIRQLGPTVEELFGTSRSFLIFTISGALGFLFSTFAGNYFTIGASGSIFGLLGALVYYGRKRGGSFGSAVYKQAGQWAVMFFIFGFLFPGIDNFAHGGGFIGGYLTASSLGYIEMKKENRTHQLLAFGAMGLTILSFLLVILN